MNSITSETKHFDDEFDIVVVGHGFAGTTAAIEAARLGAKVLVIEKSAVPGGISICSYGAVRCAADRDRAYDYLCATNGERTPAPVIRALADGMAEQEDYVRDLARVNGAEVTTTKKAGKTFANYPLPGSDAFYQTTILSIPHFSARSEYPWANGAPGGPLLFKVMADNLVKQGVEVRLSTRAMRLITAGAEREVIGITAEGPRGCINVRAKHGVILASGGFEASQSIREQFWEGKPVLNAAGQNNTGDGILMAQDVGAQLWHMWHFHGAYGFRSADPAYPYGIRVKRLPDWVPGGGAFVPRRDETGTIDAAQVKMAWILLDKSGRRFMNEYQPYTQDTAHRQLHYFDPEIQDYPRIPCFLICDDTGRKLYPLGRPTSNDQGLRHEWSADNLAEVKSGILKKGNSVAELAAALRLDQASVEQSIIRWNGLCEEGRDADFKRPPGSMLPIVSPPFYGAPVWPIVSNTQGGPVHDANQRIIDVFGKPIPHLYAAGELGSSFGHLYLSGGNISECLITGRIAGENACRSIG